MKHLFLKLVLALIIFTISGAAHAAKPRLMVLPDKTWCARNGFIKSEQRQGKTRNIEQYEDAFMNSADLKNVITTINKIFAERGFPLENAESSFSNLDEEEDEEEFIESENSGASIARTPYDMLMNKCKPDITLQVGWEVENIGFNRSITYRIEAIDAYSNKSVAAANGVGPVMSGAVPLAALLEQAVNEKVPMLTDQLERYFNDIQTNGREISLRVRTWDSAGISLSSEFGGQELGTIIYNWINDNTVNHQFTEQNSTTKAARYSQVRIPLEDATGRKLQAKQYVDQLRNYLRSFGISTANRTSGLGNGVIVIGEK